MADAANLIVSPLEGRVAAGRYGRRAGEAGVVVSEVRGAGLATVTTRKGQRPALMDAARAAWGVELPSLPRRVDGRDIAFIWCGPDLWLARAPGMPAAGMEALLAEPLAGLASIVDQSHARTILRVAGLRVREALAKGVAIDLHPRAFKVGHAAVTIVSHVGVHLWQTDERPTYELAVARSLAVSFWHWLETSAGEYGLEFGST